MSVLRAAWVLCDAPGCDRSYPGRSNYTAELAVDARLRAEERGWTRRREAGKKVDLCPEHSSTDADSREEG